MQHVATATASLEELHQAQNRRPVSKGQRTRRLRRRLRRAHQGPQGARHHRAGPEDPREPRPSRRGRRRQADGRRRRHPDPDPRRVLPRRDGGAGRRAAAARRVRRRHDLPAQGARLAAGLRAGARARGQGRRPGAARLARRAGRPRHADVADRAREGAGDPPDLHRPRPRRHRARRARAQALRDPQDGLERDPGAQAHAQPRVLRAQHELPHGHLQGPAAGRPGRPVLQGPAGPARRVGARAGAPALLDQHLPRVAARAPVPHGRAQRRDQHRQGQLQLDARARRRDEVAGARRRPEEALPDQLRRPERHRDLRQRARAADDERLPARPRRDDDDPRGVGAAHDDGRAPPRVLRVPRRDARAVGRPGRDGVHRRQADRRHARPQRPAPGALHRHRRRSRRDGVRVRRAADRREQDRQEVAPAAGQDVPDRLRAGPHRRRRGAEEPVRVRQAVPAVDRERAHQARRDPGQRRAEPTFDASRCSTASRPSATRRKTSSS